MNPLSAPSAIPSPGDLASLLPDTSGLAPLSLPAEWLSLHSRTPLPPDAIRRFQAALAASIPPPAPAKPEKPASELTSPPLQAVPFAAPAPLEPPTSFPPPPSSPDPSSLRASAPPRASAARPVLPPPADLAKRAGELAELLFSRLESIPPETLERREIRIPLFPAVIEDTFVVLTAKDGVLSVTLTPSTPAAAPVADALLPRLSEILPARIHAFSRVEVVLAPSATPPVPKASPALPPPLRVPASPRGLPSPAVLPPPADLAKQASLLAGLLFSRLETIPPATLETREIRISLESVLPEAPSAVVTAKDGVLLVTVIPSKPEAFPLASALLPRVVEMLESRLPACPRIQGALAPSGSAIPSFAPAALPSEEGESEERSPGQTPQILQALPVSAPPPPETQPSASDFRPQAAQPAAPVRPVPPAPEFAAASVPSADPGGARETNGLPRTDESLRQPDGNAGKAGKTPSSPLQPVLSALPSPLEARASSPAPRSRPATPAATPSRSGDAIPPSGRPATPSSPSPASRRTAAPPREHSPAPLQAAPLDIPAPAAASVPLADPSSAAAASARTEAVAETVERIAETVAAQITFTPSLAKGEGEVKITLAPTVLDGSGITLSSRDGTLSVTITPATAQAAQAAAAALPQLETALAAHAHAFHRVAVSLAAKKGASDETV